MKSIFSKQTDDLTFKELTVFNRSNIDDFLKQSNDLETLTDYREITEMLLSAIAHRDNQLTISEVRAYEVAIADCFGDEYLSDAVNRLRFFHRIVSPCELTDQLVSRFLVALKENATASNKRIEIANALVSMLEKSSVSDASNSLPLIKDIIIRLDVPSAPLFSRLDALQEKATMYGLGTQDAIESSSYLDRLKKLYGEITINPWSNKSESSGLKDVGTIRGILNEKASQKAREVKLFGELIDSDELQKKSSEFANQIEHGNFRIVITGEVKHGKSSVFNLLVGSEISPVEESHATTAASIEVFFNEQPSYQGKWVSEADIKKINDYFDTFSSDPSLDFEKEKFQAIIESPDFHPGGFIDDIGSTPEMRDFATTKGRNSLAVEKVRIGLPLEHLKSGAVVVDTPGLNDPFQLRDKITIEDAKLSDCIVFVMRADKFGTNSEKCFLVNLLKHGYATELVLVITHLDGRSEETQKSLMEKAQQWLEGVRKEAGIENILGQIEIFSFDARFDEDERVSIEGHGYEEFTNHLKLIAKKLHTSGDYEQRIEGRLNRLDMLMEQQAAQYLKGVDQLLHQVNEHNSLTVIKKQLGKIADVYRTDTISRLDEYRARLRLDYDESRDGLDAFKKSLTHALSDAIEKKVNELGDEYANDRKWEDFDQIECELICSREIKKFSSMISKKIEFWNKTFTSFAQEEQEDMRSKSLALLEAQQEFRNMCFTSGTTDRLFMKIDQTDRAIRSAATFFAGVSTGSVGYGGVSAILAGINLTINSPWVLPAFGGIAAAMWAASKWIGSVEERKCKYRELKIKMAREYIDHRLESLLAELKDDIYAIDARLISIVTTHCTPILIDSFATEKEIDLRLALSEKIMEGEKSIVMQRIEASAR